MSRIYANIEAAVVLRCRTCGEDLNGEEDPHGTAGDEECTEQCWPTILLVKPCLNCIKNEIQNAITNEREGAKEIAQWRKQ